MSVDRLAVVIASAPPTAWATPAALAEHIKTAMREPTEVTRERVAEALQSYWETTFIETCEADFDQLAQIAIDAMQRVNQ